VNGHHPSPSMFPALKILERNPAYQPTRYNREPYWRPPVTEPSKDCYIPTWNWRSVNADTIPAGALAATLDVNGAFLGAMATVSIAHSHLAPTGKIDWPMGPRDVQPGYYRIVVPYWAFSGTIVHPLGDSARLQTDVDVWVAAPTLVLLLELLEANALGDVAILDSYTANVATDLRKWQGRLKEIRAGLLDDRDAEHPDSIPDDCECPACSAYNAFKTGYSAALSMMLTGDKCATRRPDWSHTVYAAHAANQWRKAWRYTGTGHTLLAMGEVDTITVIAQDLPAALNRPKPPFRMDESGRALGAFKTKRTQDGSQLPDQTGGPRPTLDAHEDVL
jgi:hypothetical protein